MNDKYWNELVKLTSEFAGQIRSYEKKYGIFTPQQGKHYQTSRFILYGRAPNGRNVGYGKRYLEHSAEKAVQKTREENSKLDWLEYFNSNRFFRVGKDVVVDVLGFSKESWYEYFAWSNLMKLSPAKGGNPSDREWRIQKERCIRLFRMELEQLKPRNAVLVTDFDWAYDFLSGIGIDPEETAITARFKYVKGHYRYKDTNIVVCARPEYKKAHNFMKSLDKFIEV